MVKAISSINIVKKSLVGALFLGASCAGISAQNKYKTEDMGRKTEIMSREASNILKTNSLTGDIKMFSDGTIIHYDTAGRITKEIYSDNQGKTQCYYTHTYNQNGTPKMDTKRYPDGSIEWTRYYFYNPDKTSSDITLFDDGLIWVRYRDAKNHLTKFVVRDTLGKVISEHVYSMDADGKITETVYDADGKVIEQ